VALPPYEKPGSSVAFSLLAGLFALGEVAMQLRSRLNRSGVTSEHRSLVALVVATTVGVAGGIRLAGWRAMSVSGGRWPLFIVGLTFMAAGFVLRQWAILVLGRYFTANVRVHADQKVVERGPYRWVRHPGYSGIILFFVGLGLGLGNWASLVVLAVVPTAGLIVRIRAEEQALLAALGEPYRRFCESRRRLIPGVW
jgi:protein-S-isoprenylcysteine O-methyltransferase Ste14